MLRRIFERTGHHVFTFSAPSPCSTCHCRIGERCADVLLSDLSMPGMRGIDFLENQRRIGCKIDTMGLMSGSWKEQDQRRARKLGCRIFSKPFDIHELYHWVNGDSGRSQRVLVDHIFQNRSTKWIDKSQLT
jgi:CheY-like chemotaxis protein